MCLLLTTSTKSNPSHVTKLVEFSYGPQETTGLQKVKKKIQVLIFRSTLIFRNIPLS